VGGPVRWSRIKNETERVRGVWLAIKLLCGIVFPY
jgi:hypothetical protein